MASIGYFQYLIRGEKSPSFVMILVGIENQQRNTYVVLRNCVPTFIYVEVGKKSSVW